MSRLFPDFWRQAALKLALSIRSRRILSSLIQLYFYRLLAGSIPEKGVTRNFRSDKKQPLCGCFFGHPASPLAGVSEIKNSLFDQDFAVLLQNPS